MRLHILGVPHTRTTPEFLTCAYTQKVRNLSKMLSERGHEVLHYGVAGSEPPGAEQVDVVAAKTWQDEYGSIPRTSFYEYHETGPVYTEFYQRTNAALRERVRPWEDLVLCSFGLAHKPATEGIPTFIVESGIGYEACFAPYRVFESYAWMHHVYGMEQRKLGNWYDAVIPNYINTDEFTVETNKQPYMLYFGRLMQNKGLDIAVQVTRMLGRKLIIVGQGDPAPWLEPHVEYRPPANIEERRTLLANASAVFMPTYYIEPFGGVHIEAMASGTPVITSDFGVFNETVLHGVTGYRCRTFDQFLYAAEHIEQISPQACADWARKNFSYQRVGAMYEEYFGSILDLARPAGWYSLRPERRDLNWLNREYPVEVLETKATTKSPWLNDEETWKGAQEWELQWWKQADIAAEIVKQDAYRELMGLPADLDMGERSILDIGCGPASILSRTSATRRVGVDPLAERWPQDMAAKLADAGVTVLCARGEDFEIEECFDEVWFYNVLQHTADAGAVVENAKRHGLAVRFFEWLDTERSAGHPEQIQQQLLETAFPKSDWDRVIWRVGAITDPKFHVTTRYLAGYVVRRAHVASPIHS